MDVSYFNIDGLIALTPRKFKDMRGFFMESFNSAAFNEIVGYNVNFVQDNHSLSTEANTVRGLHFQSPPHAQGKLVRCIAGRVLDVAVDVRRDSPTYGKHVSIELSAENARQFWIPPGFLHGFSTLEPHSEFAYKVTDYYAPNCDGSVLWNDPDLGIDWGIDTNKASVSDKDALAQKFSDFVSPF